MRARRSLYARTLAATSGVVLSFALVGCWWPSDERAPLERSEEQVVWTAEHKGWACGDLTAQIMPMGDVEDSVDLSGLDLGLVFYVPPGLPSPDRLEEVAVPGNRFLIRGHYYYRQDEGRKVVAPRFDLIGWVPLPPFRRWDDGPPAVPVDDPEQTYARFDRRDSPPVEAFQIAGTYLDC